MEREPWRDDFDLVAWAMAARSPWLIRSTCERLLESATMPKALRPVLHLYMARNSAGLDELIDGRDATELMPPTSLGKTMFNPSVAFDEDARLWCVVRTSDSIPDSSNRHWGSGNPIGTANYLLGLNDDLSIESCDLIDDSEVRIDPFQFPASGLEDARLVRENGHWLLVGALREHRHDGLYQMAIDRLDGNRVVERKVLHKPESKYHEKNWMPFIFQERLQFVYSCSPTIIVGLAEDASDEEKLAEEFRQVWTVEVDEVLKYDTPQWARDLRGGSALIHMDGGWLAITHQSINVQRNNRLNFHRFVWFDEKLCLTKWSDSFTFAEPGVEFVAGMVRRRDELLVSFGVDHALAFICRLPLDGVMKMLKPLGEEWIGTR